MRSLRRARGLTLKELGARAGLSHPFLSQVERGLARPSVDSAERIAAALGVHVGQLWATPAPEPRVVRRATGASAARELVPPGTGALHAAEWTAPGDAWPAAATTAAGELLLYVVQGRVELELGGTVHALEEGDAMLFDGTSPHRLRRAGGPATRALLVGAG